MIEGIPDGWELVRVGPVKYGEWRLMESGKVMKWTTSLPSIGWAVVLRKIEKPKQYRHFANAAEFAPHRDRWTMHPNEPDKRFRAGDYDNDGVWGINGRFYDYIHLFESGTLFDDGSPFGVEVQS